jgi:hypothetical protein
MQTTGAALLAVKRCSPMRVRMPAQDSRSVHRLLYLAAVRDADREPGVFSLANVDESEVIVIVRIVVVDLVAGVNAALAILTGRFRLAQHSYQRHMLVMRDAML